MTERPLVWKPSWTLLSHCDNQQAEASLPAQTHIRLQISGKHSSLSAPEPHASLSSTQLLWFLSRRSMSVWKPATFTVSAVSLPTWEEQAPGAPSEHPSHWCDDGHTDKMLIWLVISIRWCWWWTYGQDADLHCYQHQVDKSELWERKYITGMTVNPVEEEWSGHTKAEERWETWFLL